MNLHYKWAEALRRNDFQSAWRLSDASLAEHRFSGVAKHAGERHLQRIWRGEDLKNRSVLVRCYHGLGDTIQFIRFAKPLREIAREVIVWSQPELLSLVRQVNGVDRVLPLHEGTPDASFDVDIEVMELAHALRVTSQLITNRVLSSARRAQELVKLQAIDRNRLGSRQLESKPIRSSPSIRPLARAVGCAAAFASARPRSRLGRNDPRR